MQVNENTDYELELYVLYILTNYNDKYFDCDFKKNDFGFDLTQGIFEFLQNKITYGLPVNPKDLENFIIENYKEVSIANFLNDFQISSYKMLNLQKAARSLQDLSDKRMIKGLILEQHKNIADASKNAQEIKELITEGLDEVKSFKQESKSVDSKQALVEAFKDRAESIKTGFIELDKITTGFQKGSFIVVAGASSMGKSAMAMNIAVNIAKQGKAIAIFSLEMSVAQITRRLVANLGSLNLTKLKNDNLTSQYEQEAFTKTIDIVGKLPITFNDDGMLNLQRLRQEIKNLIKKNKVEVVLIDYVQLVKHNGGGNEVQKITEITNYLKALAMEFKIVIIGLSQLSRGVANRENKRPTLGDLRSSGSLEQDADCVIFLFRPEYYLNNEKPSDVNSRDFKSWQESMNKLKGIAYAIVAKNRDGGLGDANLHFEGEFMRFTERGGI